jgi:serine/threonine-protein kinase
MTGGGEQTEDTAAALSFIGTELGSYRLEELLGEGGMGWVYLARHTSIGRRVAIKMLRPGLANHPMAVSRFFAEAQVVNKINHENIVEIYDCVSSSEEHIAYLVLEPLDGRDLLRALQTGETISLERKLTIMIQVARALGAAHEAGVVHRDLKPANIFISRRGGQEDFVKVLDFGIAKLRTMQSSSTRMTQVGTSLGTPAYLSPEQALGAAVEPRTDIYSFGVILYELATGLLPFDSESVTDMVSRHVLEKPVRPREISDGARSSIPPVLDDLIMRCLAKKPEERPESMAEVARVLEEVKSRLGEASAPEPVAEPERRRRRGWLLAGAAVVLLAGGAAAAYAAGVLPVPWEAESEVVAGPVASAEPTPAAAAESPPVSTAEPVATAPPPELEPEPDLDPEPAAEPVAAPAPAPHAALAPRRPTAARKPAPRPDAHSPTPIAPVAAAPAKPISAAPTAPPEVVTPPPAAPAPAPARPSAPPPRPAADRGSLDAVPTVARLSVSGLPRGEIDGAIKRVGDSMRSCYRAAAKKANRTPAVTLTISFSIDEGGAARRVQVSGDTLGVAACVQAAVSKVRSRIPPDVGQASAVAIVKFQPTR